MMKKNALTYIFMSDPRAPELGINSWLEDELYQQYLSDRKNVDESWKEVFETNGGSAPEAPAPAAANGSHPAKIHRETAATNSSTGSRIAQWRIKLHFRNISRSRARH